MRSHILSSGLIAFALLAPCTVRAQQGATTAVDVNVTDPAGAPIPHARIEVFIPDQYGDFTTDEQGHISLNLRTGNYVIDTFVPGYGGAQVNTNVTSGGGAENAAKSVTFVLQPDDFALPARADGSKRNLSQSPKTDDFYSSSKLVMMAHLQTKDGFFFTRNTYQGPDGEKVYFEVFHYHSAARVKKEFDGRLQEAVRVLDHQKTIDEAGNIKAEMAVITIKTEEEDAAPLIIVRTGDDFRQVRSCSLEDILAVAKDMTSRAQSQQPLHREDR